MNLQNKMYDPSLTILMAEDDADDRFLMSRAFRQLGMDKALQFVTDGEELMAYLNSCGNSSDKESLSLPALLFLDLNMPRKDGREALKEIRANPNFRDLPVVVWTTSRHEEDIAFCHVNGASSYATKPHGYEELVVTIRNILNEWLPPPAQTTGSAIAHGKRLENKRDLSVHSTQAFF
jgi:CheY-like chemotaxis protein